MINLMWGLLLNAIKWRGSCVRNNQRPNIVAVANQNNFCYIFVLLLLTFEWYTSINKELYKNTASSTTELLNELKINNKQIPKDWEKKYPSSIRQEKKKTLFTKLTIDCVHLNPTRVDIVPNQFLDNKIKHQFKYMIRKLSDTNGPIHQIK